MAKQYAVVYMGKLQPNARRSEVVARVSSLFKFSPAKAEKFIASEKPLAIKRDLTQEMAQKYKERLTWIGLQIKLYETTEQTGPEDNLSNTVKTTSSDTIPIKHDQNQADLAKPPETQELECNSFYAPPTSELKEHRTRRDFVYATKWQRFFNYLIDAFGKILFAAIIGAIAGIIGGDDAIALMESTPDIIFGLIILILYYFTLEFFTGRTLGKVITKTVVVDEDGNRPSWRKVLGRTFTRIVPFEAFTFLGQEGRGLHDKWPKTYVIKK